MVILLFTRYLMLATAIESLFSESPTIFSFGQLNKLKPQVIFPQPFLDTEWVRTHNFHLDIIY